MKPGMCVRCITGKSPMNHYGKNSWVIQLTNTIHFIGIGILEFSFSYLEITAIRNGPVESVSVSCLAQSTIESISVSEQEEECTVQMTVSDIPDAQNLNDNDEIQQKIHHTTNQIIHNQHLTNL